jgi:hypothetical protein
MSKGKLNAADKLLNECMRKDIRENEMNRLNAVEGLKDTLVDRGDSDF